MHVVQTWPAAPELRGIVDLSYRVIVRAAAPPVLPDGRAGLVWLSDGTVQVCGPESRPWRPDRPGVEAVGVRLTLGMVPVLLGVPASVLTDRRVDLRDLWGSVGAGVAERATRAAEPRMRALVLQEAVRLRGASAVQPDPVARHLTQRLNLGPVPVHRLAAEVGLSERQLRRRCQHAFGYSPAMLARLLRLHRFLRLAQVAMPGTGLAGLAAAAGYSDQSHLARESRVLTGRRPSVFLRSAGVAVSDSFKTELAPAASVREHRVRGDEVSVSEDRNSRLAEAIELVGQGERAQARRRLADLWTELEQEGDILQRCAVAHHMADVQDDPRDELTWDLRALHEADSLTQEALTQAGATGSVAGLYPSLHLNLGEDYRKLGDLPATRHYLKLGQRATVGLGDDGYSRMIRGGLDALADRLDSKNSGVPGS